MSSRDVSEGTHVCVWAAVYGPYARLHMHSSQGGGYARPCVGTPRLLGARLALLTLTHQPPC